MVAKSYRLPVIDGVLNDIRDQGALRRESQAVKWRAKIVAAYEMPENVGKGVIKIEGVVVERLHVETTQKKLAQLTEASLGRNVGADF